MVENFKGEDKSAWLVATFQIHDPLPETLFMDSHVEHFPSVVEITFRNLQHVSES